MLATLADAFRRNPYPVYRVLRRVRPVLKLPRGIWLLLDHDSVKHALHEPAVFSSRAAPPGGAPLEWFIFQDPPLHTRLRGLVSRAFTSRAIADLEPRIEALAHRLLDAAMPAGRMDLVRDFAEPIPHNVIADLMGIPPADVPRIARWGDAIIHLGDMIYGGERAARAATVYRESKDEMRPYLAGMLDERRTAPRDDLVSRLQQAELDGERLSEDDIFSFFQLLLLAGTETTTNLISSAAIAFMEHPEQLERVRADRTLLPAAIEEVLRYRSPVQLVFRTTTRDVELHGQLIPAGALVLASTGSANRDPRQFPHPERFDIARPAVPHLAFGHGIHFCIGAALARLEARVALSVLLDRVPRLRRDGPRAWAPRTGINVNGPRSLPVRLE